MTKKTNHLFKSTVISKFVVENKIILLVLFVAFLLRFPSLFDPLLNDRETYLITYAANLLPKEASLPLMDLPLVAFSKIAFFLFGETLWSVKFLLLIYFLGSLFLITLSLKKFFVGKNLTLTGLLFALIFGLPFFGTNQVNLALYLPPVLICVLILIKRGLLESRFNNRLSLILPLLVGLVTFLAPHTSVSANYYQNFLEYSASRISHSSGADEKYFESFGNDVRQSYSLAFFVKRKTSAQDSIFIAGRQIAIYFLADRKVASKNVLLDQFKEVDELLTDIEIRKPVYILYDKKIGRLGELDRLLNKSYNLSAQENNVKIYVRKDT